MVGNRETRVINPKLRSEGQEILRRCGELFGAAETQDLSGTIAEKAAEFQHYDVLGIDRVAVVLMWGRSGSLLLCSYLDGHDDVLLVPERCGERIYEFFERHSDWPLRDKLLGYAAYEPQYPEFFEGDFAIPALQYYAAVQAIIQADRQWPEEFLKSRRAFFLFVHIAYALALGRRSASAAPLIVFEQHAWNNEMARQLVEDFPQARFVHTVRDPISTCDAGFGLHVKYVFNHIFTPYSALAFLADADRPHCGMEKRTCAVRFEDLHSRLAETMRHLSAWLDIPFQAALLQSTFNDIPYVVSRDGISWTGARLEQTKRRSLALSWMDRAILFSVFHENFAEWNYDCPAIFKIVALRVAVFGVFCFFPMKMEWISGCGVFRLRVIPALRDGNLRMAMKSLGALAFCRMKIIRLLGWVLFRRCNADPPLLRVLNLRGEGPAGTWRPGLGARRRVNK